MIWTDKNQSWTPPKGYALKSVTAEGAYLRLDYRHVLHDRQIVQVFLTDMGREIGRNMYESPDLPPAAPKKWWEKLIYLLP